MSSFNLLKLSLRTLGRAKTFSLVNIIGLALGMASCAFVFLYAYHSLTFDHQHEHLETIYRINSSWVGNTSQKAMAITAQPVGPHLQENHSFVEAACRISLMNDHPTLTVQGKSFEARNFRESERSILEVFTFDFLDGNSATALANPNDIIMSRSWAIRMFGTTQCVGEVLLQGEKQLRVSGVYKDWPQNTDLPISGVILTDLPSSQWENFAYYTYVKTQSPDMKRLAHILTGLSEERSKDNPHNDEHILLQPQPLKGIHFAESILGDMPKGNKAYTYLFLVTGFILLLVVLANTSNLGVIRAIDQIPQIGLKKVLGAGRLHIIRDQLIELLLLFGASLLLAITLFQLATPYFSSLSGIEVTLREHLGFLLGIVFAMLVLVLLTGLYAALATSGLSPSNTLRNHLSTGLPGSTARKYMVVLQFVVTGVLSSGLLVLFAQWNYIKNKDMGFNQTDILVVSLGKGNLDLVPVQNHLASLLGEEQISVGSWGSMPGSSPPFSTATIIQQSGTMELPMHIIDIDAHFLNLFEIPLVDGEMPRPLSDEELASGVLQGVLVNESLARLLDGPSAHISLPWMKARVDGTISDYHYQSLHNKIEPLMVLPRREGQPVTELFIKARPEQRELVESILLHYWPSGSFQVEPLSQKLLSHYPQMHQAIRLIQYFAILSLFISSLGLFGIVAYTLKKRIYEIGIRKVLGAGYRHLVVLFGKEVLLLLLCASVLAFPVAVLLKEHIFGLYAVQPHLHSAWLLLPNLLASTLAFLVVLVQVKWAFATNPSKLLRSD